MKNNLLSIFTITLSIAIIVLAAMQLLGLWDRAIYVFEPLAGLALLLQAIQYRHRSKAVAISCLCASLFIFGVAIFIIFF